MFGSKIEKATADWPHSKVLAKEGCVHVTGKYVQPWLNRYPAAVYNLLAIILIVFILGSQSNTENQTLMVMVVAIITILIAVYFYVWKPAVIGLLGKNVDVKISPELIQVKQGFGYKNYSTDERIEFGVEKHMKGFEEEHREQSTQQRQSRTYRQAVEVVMWYGEKRVVIAEMIENEVEKANALVLRLQQTCMNFDRMKEMMQPGQAVPEEQPMGDFGPAPDVR